MRRAFLIPVSAALTALVPAGTAEATQAAPPPVRVEARRSDESQPLLALSTSTSELDGDVTYAFHGSHSSHSSHSSHYSGHSSHSSHLSHVSSVNPPNGEGNDVYDDPYVDPYVNPYETEAPRPKPKPKRKPKPNRHEPSPTPTTTSPSPPLDPGPSETTEDPTPLATTSPTMTPTRAVTTVRKEHAADTSSLGTLGRCCCFIAMGGIAAAFFALRRGKCRR